MVGKFALGAAVLLVTGCALGSGMEAPSITISSLRLENSTLLEQRFLTTLRIQNPNAVDLPVEGVSFSLEVNGQPFAKGVGKGPVVVPAFGQGVIEAEAITTLMGFVRQFREVERAQRPKLAYQLTGKLTLRDRSFPVAFEMRGDDLWDVAGATPRATQ